MDKDTVLPLSIVLIVPMCLLAAVTGLLIRGMPIDVLAEIGFVVLVGLAAKNAILIVEFARQHQDKEGATPKDAAVQAAHTRLRPILMTSFAFIFGVIPLADRHRSWCRNAPIPWDGRPVRHDRRDRFRPSVHSGLLQSRPPTGWKDGGHLVNALAKLTAAALGAINLAVAACAVGPDYKMPDTNLVPFHNASKVVAPDTSQARTRLDQWWTGFNDPMLVTVVQRALRQNLDLAAALARVRQARAAASGAGAALAPTVDFDVAATYEHQSLRGPFGSIASTVPGFTRDLHEYSLGPAASWEIDLFGGLRRGATAARDEAQAAEAAQAGTRVTVAADAADAYLQIRGYQARISVAQKQVDTDNHLFDTGA